MDQDLRMMGFLMSGVCILFCLCALVAVVVGFIRGTIGAGKLVLLILAFSIGCCFVISGMMHMVIGGRAELGEIRDGRYYVKEFLQYTEVSPRVYWFDLWFSSIINPMFGVVVLVSAAYGVWHHCTRKRRSQLEPGEGPDWT